MELLNQRLNLWIMCESSQSDCKLDFLNFDIHKMYLSSFISFEFLFIYFEKKTQTQKTFLMRSASKQASKKANSQSIDRKINGKSSTNNRFNTIALKTVKNVNKNSISNSILQMVSWCCYGCCYGCCCYCCCYCCKQQLLIEFKCSKKKLENLSIKYSICLWKMLLTLKTEKEHIESMYIKKKEQYYKEWDKSPLKLEMKLKLKI